MANNYKGRGREIKFNKNVECFDNYWFKKSVVCNLTLFVHKDSSFGVIKCARINEQNGINWNILYFADI